MRQLRHVNSNRLWSMRKGTSFWLLIVLVLIAIASGCASKGKYYINSTPEGADIYQYHGGWFDNYPNGPEDFKKTGKKTPAVFGGKVASITYFIVKKEGYEESCIIPLQSLPSKMEVWEGGPHYEYDFQVNLSLAHGTSQGAVKENLNFCDNSQASFTATPLHTPQDANWMHSREEEWSKVREGAMVTPLKNKCIYFREEPSLSSKTTRYCFEPPANQDPSIKASLLPPSNADIYFKKRQEWFYQVDIIGEPTLKGVWVDPRFVHVNPSCAHGGILISETSPGLLEIYFHNTIRFSCMLHDAVYCYEVPSWKVNAETEQSYKSKKFDGSTVRVEPNSKALLGSFRIESSNVDSVFCKYSLGHYDSLKEATYPLTDGE